MGFSAQDPELAPGVKLEDIPFVGGIRPQERMESPLRCKTNPRQQGPAAQQQETSLGTHQYDVIRKNVEPTQDSEEKAQGERRLYQCHVLAKSIQGYAGIDRVKK